MQLICNKLPEYNFQLIIDVFEKTFNLEVKIIYKCWLGKVSAVANISPADVLNERKPSATSAYNVSKQ